MRFESPWSGQYSPSLATRAVGNRNTDRGLNSPVIRATIGVMTPPKPTPAPQAQLPKAERAPKSRAKAAPGKHKTDWQAVERDYRTGKFTLRELSTKHGPSHQAIAKQAKNNKWSQDLSLAIKQATNAKLVDALVAKEVAKSGQAVADTVLAAAELNKDVILGHRKDAQAAQAAMQQAMTAVLNAGANVTELKDAALFASAVECLSRTVKNIVSIERQAFRLDDDPAERVNAETERYARMSMTERAARINLIMEKARRNAEAAGEAP